MNPPPTTTDPGEIRPPLDAPPILGSWSRMYVLVLAVLVAGVLLFAWLTKVYQ